MKDSIIFFAICTIVALILINLVCLMPYEAQVESHGIYYRVVSGTVVF